MNLKFSTFNSEIELPFYSALFSFKLDHDRLSDSARPVLGLYEPRPQADPDSSTKLQILGNALTSNQVPLGLTRAQGSIKNVNTIEDFKNTDKNGMLVNAGRQIWDAIQDGTIYSLPALLSSFIILSFADLKKYKFTYWFAFPALHSSPQWKRTGPVGHINSKESTALVERVGTWRYSVDNREHGFFLVKKVPRDDANSRTSLDEPNMDIGFEWEIGSLKDFETGFFNNIEEEDRYVAFVDPSNYPEYPSWPLRNLLVLIRQRYRLNKVQILCYRDTQPRRHEARSIILPLAMDPVDDIVLKEMPKVTGWERNVNGDLKARVANLAEYMDPTRLADQAVDLNLKLMKWRLSPNLDLDTIKNTRCLLLGAGTLGSYVSRNLMGWGVRKITFIDYGTVSFSNPVRQPLFEFKDCLGGGKPKAIRAAEALKEIYPGVDAEAHVLSVPMLDHSVVDEAKTKADFTKLQELVDSHDAIFLLMDTRESRWLPTVMGKAKNKIVMNAALGFDTYVVMRHGAPPKDGTEDTLGCYFCNDVVVAADSIKDQTLDQQCTVTRPGVAAIASALLVELLTSILQHPEKQHAPAPVPTAGGSGSGSITYQRDPPDHTLGIVPHQIRGFLSNFQNMVIRGQSYPQCSACSKPITSAYKAEGWDFVKKALGSRDYVAELSGLAEVQRLAELAAADVEWSEEEMAEEDGEGVMI
ncbi:ubiquitin-like modifier-activating enzyme atg-7 [Apodospora peruviana]|uniref:Ubiquitin-like modifier-activating enzyme ATG7 n=1 Tax=Apodospora peruviana TaxID=516989 RepID=A0AAE0MCC2_9PEZI|nr:ubiquitin-like modifier-activating enzyme atg-7 [Apodospora peruviana]